MRSPQQEGYNEQDAPEHSLHVTASLVNRYVFSARIGGPPTLKAIRMPNGELRSKWANTRKNQGFENVLKRAQVNVGCSGVNKRNLPLTTERSRSSPSQPVFDGSFADGNLTAFVCGCGNYDLNPTREEIEQKMSCRLSL
jgi:hypothetical protein